MTDRHDHRDHCPVCNSDTIDRIHGEWCPRCRRWVVFVAEFGQAYWTLSPVLL